MTTSNTHPHPLEIEPDNTSGEDTENNYHYQHAYGVILLIGAACQSLQYESVYAEHHEDLLCERSDHKVDGYQIKTRDADQGSWELNHDALRKSIKRFVQLNNEFPEYMGELNFVSNAGFSAPGYGIKDQKELRKSPVRFLEVVRKYSCAGEIPEPFDETLQELREYCDCTPDELFATLKKMGLVSGPERHSYESDITAKHLFSIKECMAYTIPVLNAIRDELINKVWIASHISRDPSIHWYPIGKVSFSNPHITSKRVPVSIVMQTVRDKAEPPFRYYGEPTIKFGSRQGSLWKLQMKMKRGELHSHIRTMEHRTLAAERKLMELYFQKTEEFDGFLTQLEMVVQGECDEANLHASLKGEPFGPQMLDDVYNRLRQKAEHHSDLVLRQQYELLIGIAGLLSEKCSVWWSKEFDLEGAE